METFFLKKKLQGNFYESKFFKESWNFELCFCYMTFQKFLEFRLFGKILKNFLKNLSREKLLYLNEYENEIFHLDLSLFNKLQNNVTTCPFRRVTKIKHSESFKHNICSIGMLCAVVWLHRVHLQKQPPEVFLKKSCP